MKTLIITGLTIVTIASSSCKKDYHCVCSNSSNNLSFDYPLVDMKKQEAQKDCETIKYNWETTGGTCSLSK